MQNLITKVKMGLLGGIFIPSFLQAIPWPVDVIPNDKECFGGAYMDYRYDGIDRMFHHGVDIAVEKEGGTVSYTSSGGGFIAGKNETGNSKYYWISVKETSEDPYAWYYGHTEKFWNIVNGQKIPWYVDDPVSKNDRLCQIVDFPGSFPFGGDHLEFGKWDSSSHKGQLNPLQVLDNYSDTRPPKFYDEWHFCNQDTGEFFKKPLTSNYKLYGKVDIIVSVEDQTRNNWGAWYDDAGIYKIGYQIFKKGKEVLSFHKLMEATGQQPDDDLVDVVYQRGIEFSGNSDFYYIVTNTDNDGVIEESDKNQCWDTTKISDGEYTIRVSAYDVAGNSLTNEINVYVVNKTSAKIKVINEEGNPVQGALVVVKDVDGEIGSGTTDFEGYYTIYNIPVGNYTVEISKQGFISKTQNISVTNWDETNIISNISLKRPGYLTGTVRDRISGAKIKDAQVKVLPGDVIGYTDDNGVYLLTLKPGSYQLTVSKANYVSKTEVGIVVNSADGTYKDFLLDPYGSILGNVRDPNGMLISNVKIEAINTEYQTTTDQNGNYNLTLPPGTYDIKASKSGYSEQVKNGVYVNSGQQTLGINFVLDTRPTPPVVIDDGKYTNNLTQLHAIWLPSTSASGIVEYQYAIGTNKGGVDIVGWTSVGMATGTVKHGLSLVEGKTYYFSVKARNGVGLWSELGYSDGIIPDITPPDTFIGTSFYIEPFIFYSWEGRDNLSSLQYSYRLLNIHPEWSNWTEKTNAGFSLPFGTGTYTFEVKAKDEAGNEDLIPDKDVFTVEVKDTTPPEIIPPEPDKKVTKPGDEVELSLKVTDDISGISSVIIDLSSIGGSANQNMEACGDFYTYKAMVSLDTQLGTKTLNITAEDNARNLIVEKITIIVETPPTIPVVTDSGMYTNNSTQLSVRWSSSDSETGIAEYQYCIGTTKGGTDTLNWKSSGISTEITETGLSLIEGTTYYFTVKAKNGAGLWSLPGYSDGITVDITQPLITNSQAMPNQPAPSQNVKLTANITDDLSGIKAVIINLSPIGGSASQPMFDNGTNGDEKANDGTYTFAYTIPASILEGTKTLIITAKDNANNFQTASITLLIISPSVSLSGRIIDSMTNEPIVNAMIEVIKDGNIISSCSSNYEGKYKIDKLMQGIYEIRVSKERIFRWWWWTWRVLEYIPHTKFSVSIDGKKPVDFYLSKASWVENAHIQEGNIANTDTEKNMDVSIRVNYDPDYWFYLYPNDTSYEINNFLRQSIGLNGCYSIRWVRWWWFWWPIYSWYNIDWDNGTYIDRDNNRLHIKVWIGGYWWNRAYFNYRYTIEAQKALSSLSSFHPILRFEEPKRTFPPGKVKLQMLSKEDREKMGIADAEDEVVSIMVKDVKDSLTTAEIKLTYDPEILNIEDVIAPILPDPGLAVFCAKDTDGIKSLEDNNSLTIRTLIVDKDMLIGTYTFGTPSLSYGTETQEGTETTEEENIAPIAHLIIKPTRFSKSLSLNDILSSISIGSIELKNAKGEEIKVDVEKDYSLPKVSSLLQSYPNPAKDGCFIPFKLSEDSNVKIEVYNILGQKIRTIDGGYKKAGFYTKQDRAIFWDLKNNAGQKVSKGLYFYKLTAGKFSSTKAMVVK